MILLSPPAVLALISNDAVPGEATYPIKRTLEAGILIVASVHPTTKAMFTAERSDRRFREVTTLIESGDRGQNVTQTLGEFIKQTREAAKDIKEIKNPIVKKERVVKLKESIIEYKAGLELKQKKLSEEKEDSTSIVPPIAQIPSQTQSPSSVSPTSGPAPTIKVEITPTHAPGLTPTPTRIISNPSPTPIPNVQEPDCTDPNLSEAMKKALNCLDQIDDGLNTDEASPPPDSTAGDEAPPGTAGDEIVPTQGSEPQPIPTEELVPTTEPTLEPTPEEPPAIQEIRQRSIEVTPEVSSAPQIEAKSTP